MILMRLLKFRVILNHSENSFILDSLIVSLLDSQKTENKTVFVRFIRLTDTKSLSFDPC